MQVADIAGVDAILALSGAARACMPLDMADMQQQSTRSACYCLQEHAAANAPPACSAQSWLEELSPWCLYEFSFGQGSHARTKKVCEL